MSIRKRAAKKSKNGFTYQVYFPFVDSSGIKTIYRKSGFKTKKDALEHEAEMKERLRVNKGVYERNLTFNQVYEEYMKVVGERKYVPATKGYYSFSYTKYIRDRIGKRKIDNLRYNDLQAFLNSDLMTPSNAYNTKKVLCVVFKYALKSKYISDNPMQLVTLENSYKPKEKNPVISENQLYQIIDDILIVDKHCAHKEYVQFNNYSYAVAIFIGWYLGMRASEVLGLKKSDFDFDKKTVTIQRRLEYHGLSKKELKLTNKLKTKASYATLPLSDPLIKGLKKWFEINPYDYVIVDINGDLIHPSSMNNRIYLVCKRLEIDFKFHALRHSFTTNLIAHGVKPNVVKELVRHSNISTTLGIYTHIQENELSETIQKVFNDKKK